MSVNWKFLIALGLSLAFLVALMVDAEAGKWPENEDLRMWAHVQEQINPNQSLRVVLSDVNRLVNRTRYTPDWQYDGASDHWATPSQFFTKGGDCEDYAVLKYLLLRDLVAYPDRLRILITWKRGRGQHAVLEYAGHVLDNERFDLGRVEDYFVVAEVLPGGEVVQPTEDLRP